MKIKYVKREPRYELTRDGKHETSGTYIEIMNYIHSTHSYSLDWALRHEGFVMTEEKKR